MQCRMPSPGPMQCGAACCDTCSVDTQLDTQRVTYYPRVLVDGMHQAAPKKNASRVGREANGRRHPMGLHQVG